MRTHRELHTAPIAGKLNWLRAAVLGANDGIVSLAALVVGVAGASVPSGVIFVTGIAGLLAGAFSMAVGEYVSVSSQRDAERALLDKERYELEHYAGPELDELTSLYEKKGLNPGTARTVAEELTAHDVFAAHAEAELGINPKELTNPWHAAGASAAAFTVGALIPLLAILIPPAPLRIPVTFAAVLVALTITGVVSARATGVKTIPATLRVLIGGILAMAITFLIGRLFEGAA
ncbi:MAG: VIT family protein [Bacillota bacterium]